MNDWNVVVSVHTDGFRDALRLLRAWGEVAKTDFFNVLVVKVEEPVRFLEQLRDRVEEEPGTLNFIGHARPVTAAFFFRSPEEFEERASETALRWVPELKGKSFHVRMHRRGFKGRLSSQQEEQLVAGALLEALEEAGDPGRITFEDPDAIVAVETVGERAGMSLWRREDLRRYPFLGLD